MSCSAEVSQGSTLRPLLLTVKNHQLRGRQRFMAHIISSLYCTSVWMTLDQLMACLVAACCWFPISCLQLVGKTYGFIPLISAYQLKASIFINLHLQGQCFSTLLLSLQIICDGHLVSQVCELDRACNCHMYVLYHICAIPYDVTFMTIGCITNGSRKIVITCCYIH